MIIPDLNLLVYAYDSTAREHERARVWWAECLSGDSTVGLPWIVALGFVRLWTSPRVFINPMEVGVAVSHVESWLSRRAVNILNPGTRHAEIVFRLLREAGRGGNLTTDAHLAALAIEHKGVVHTADVDFLRLPGVEWLNPLKTA